MLSVIINRGNPDIQDKNYVFSPDTYFNYNFEESWMEDPLTKEMVKDIDKSEIISPNVIVSQVLGPIPPEKLSGGVKALIIMNMDPGVIVNASACGENCAKWILEIGRRKDITIRLGYAMEFPEPFDMKIVNSGNIIHDGLSFLKEFTEVEIGEG